MNFLVFRGKCTWLLGALWGRILIIDIIIIIIVLGVGVLIIGTQA